MKSNEHLRKNISFDLFNEKLLIYSAAQELIHSMALTLSTLKERKNVRT
jgi:hypothetical protein